MATRTVKNTFTLILTLASALAAILFKVPPVWLILSGAVLGVVYRQAVAAGLAPLPPESGKEPNP
ncbi:hypothetical protein SDC9_177694 [bioreactor metagenome]|uniref:Uncharacterized protein n=1 Tax=bioreactor metagenome TaxID=1076179 RepID=A0A645GTQ1_9ZZZZ